MPSLVVLDNTLGAATLGSFFSAIVFGITCLQTFLYLTKYGSKDPPFLRYTVLTIWLLDAVHQGLLITIIYHYSILNFGDFVVVSKTTWSLEANVAVGSLLTCIVQSFYAWRVWLLNGKKLLIPVTIVLLSLSHYGFALALMVEGLRIHLNAVPSEIPWTIAALSTDLAADILIASSICYFLATERSESEFTRMKQTLNTLIVYTVSSCALTGFCVAMCLAFFAYRPDKLLFTPWYFVACRFYAVSLLSMLNGREYVRNKLHHGHQTIQSVGLSKIVYRVRDVETNLSENLTVDHNRGSMGSSVEYPRFEEERRDSRAFSGYGAKG